MRYPIRFDAWYRLPSTLLGMSPSRSFVEISGDDLEVRMGWGFRVRVPLSVIKAIAIREKGLPRISRGVHGVRGRWLVNGSGRGIVAIDLSEKQQARVLGFRVGVDRLEISMVDPVGLSEALTRAASAA